MTRSEFRYVTETCFYVKLNSGHTNLLRTKWLSFSGVLQQSATAKTKECMWSNLPFVLQKHAWLQLTSLPAFKIKIKQNKKNNMVYCADFLPKPTETKHHYNNLTNQEQNNTIFLDKVATLCIINTIPKSPRIEKNNTMSLFCRHILAT